jgi:hypothetical protein
LSPRRPRGPAWSHPSHTGTRAEGPDHDGDIDVGKGRTLTLKSADWPGPDARPQAAVGSASGPSAPPSLDVRFAIVHPNRVPEIPSQSFQRVRSSGLAILLVPRVQGEFLRAPLPSPTCSLLPRAGAGLAPVAGEPDTQCVSGNEKRGLQGSLLRARHRWSQGAMLAPVSGHQPRRVKTVLDLVGRVGDLRCDGARGQVLHISRWQPGTRQACRPARGPARRPPRCAAPARWRATW